MDTSATSRFEGFEIEPARRRVLINGEPAKIGARAFDLLLALIERRKRVVGKQELLDLVWPNVTVEEGNLQVHIFALRKMLGARAITTIPGRGYQFTGAPEEPEALSLRASLTPRLADARLDFGNLPPNLPPLYGRADDAAALKALIAEHRLVSLVGPGGIGKTRLARGVAHDLRADYADGAWLVELAPIENAELTAQTVARALGHTPRPRDTASLVEAMRDQELLLVLDNCEHLTSAVAELAAAILIGAPGVKLLVTSQERLRLAEERTYRLGPLAVPKTADAATALDHGAVALLVARAQAVDARFGLSEDNVGAIVEICARLDGLPLAIELAAARIPLLGVLGVRQRLDERMQLLAGGSREALPRHRALSAALEWSFGLLSGEERRALDLLGIFVGGFSLEAASELIAGEGVDEWAAMEQLSALIDKSLVMVDPGEPPRYRLLESTRAFALERIATAGAVDAARRKHALALIASLRRNGFQKSASERALALAPDLDNLRAALTWAVSPGGDRAIAIELAAESNFIWHVLGYNDEGAGLFRIVERWVDSSTPAPVAAKFWLSRAKLYPSASQTAADDALKAADVFRTLGDRERLFDALIAAASQFNYSGDFLAAERTLAEAGTILDPTWPRWTRVMFELVSGGAKYWAGECAEARGRLCRALELSREGGEASQTEWIEMMIVGCDVAMRNWRGALRMGREMLARSHPPMSGFNRVVTENFVIASLIQKGELEEAETAFRAALPRVRDALGSARTTLCYVAFLAARQGRCADAARLLGAIDGLRPPGAAILAPPNQACYDDAAAIALGTLEADEFGRLKGEGRALSESEAMALAFPR
jgi:predicted ATPase/DNA-binding winged helix-turn-helix (wHTH) protein